MTCGRTRQLSLSAWPRCSPSSGRMSCTRTAIPGIGPLLTLRLCTSGPFGVELAVRSMPNGIFKDEVSWAVWLGAVRVSNSCNQAAIHGEETVRRQCDFPRLGRPGCQSGGRAGETSEVRHRVGRAGNDPPARPFFTELSLVVDFRCPKRAKLGEISDRRRPDPPGGDSAYRQVHRAARR